ncbi:mas-related G-protein coupled receptor member D-like [Pantherophis guttatus]|uniref:Mas-related G-protein coupled receptor member D-like n=1 Tax=Pantherophis guttatus TaxID=94885 RepID=A0ABM3YXW8_PANGU|nr:mas-related G-protein coupled receptor member D-like [Pantherophis guttatus]XP_060540964.1 mas-related G-protein coupled receptor member D-like [Pantherophis guttatus]XP_060548373.1 mas-related G-protein coupled receptor member D-like [Pantherophis guttatus]
MNMTSPPPTIADSENKTCSPEKGEGIIIFAIFTVLFCVLGMLGNGLVIWLLGSSVKRNTFAIYIINLSVADFGFLTFELIIEIHWFFTHLYCDFPYELFQTGLLLMYSTGQFLLTIISIDRCVSVLFPIWYRCHRPAHLFTSVCAAIWAICFILSLVYFTIASFHKYELKHSLKYQFIVNAVLCLPLMTISSVVLFVKIYFLSKIQRRRKLLTAVLLTLFFFLVLAFPLNAFYFILYVFKNIHPNLLYYGYLCTCINSSINPLIYYLVGRQKGKTQRNIKDLLQKVFKEEENSSDQMETSEGSKI